MSDRSPLSRAGRHDYLCYAVIFTGTLSVYLWSLPRTIVLEDDGLFILAAYFNGTAHPPGYPLYTLLGHIATWMPVGSVAARVHFLTAVLGALACVCLFHVIRRMVSGRFYALVASLAFGFSLTFWSQAIIAEVYSLNVLLFLLLLALSMSYLHAASAARRQVIMNWAGFIYGLGLSNHWPLLVLSTPVLVAILAPCWREVFRQLPRSLLFCLLGLLPYAWMIWRSHMDPLISFYGPINDWREFWFYVSREGYAEVDSSTSAGWGDKLGFVRFILVETARQFTMGGMVLITAGFLGQWRQWKWPLPLGLTLGFVGNTFVLTGLLGFDHDFFHQNIFRVYPVIAYAICAIWLALGLKMVLDSVILPLNFITMPRLLQAMTGGLVVGTTLLANAADNYRATDTWAEDYSRIVLESLDKNAALFTYSDAEVWTIGYVHYILGIRPDISLYNLKGTVYSNRLYKPHTLPRRQVEEIIESFVQATAMPVFYTSIFIPHDSAIDYGLIKKLNKNADRQVQAAVILPDIRRYFEGLLARGEPVDNWEKMHYRLLTASNCLQSVRIMRTSSHEMIDVKEHAEWIDRVCNNFQAYMQYIGYLLELGHTGDEVQGLIKKAEELKHQAIVKAELAQLAHYKGKVYRDNNELDDSEAIYERSSTMQPHAENKSSTQFSMPDAHGY